VVKLSFHGYSFAMKELKKRIGILSIGLIVNWAMTWGFNFLLYPFLVYIYGIFLGGLIMMILSFFLCYGTILFYDWTKRDWIGIETIKGIKELNPKNKAGKFFSWVVKKGDPAILLFLSIKFDPFITVAYMRHGAHKYNGLSKRDWTIFLISLILGDIYWVLTVYLGITVIEAVLRLI
jgi:hypothetical protein